MKVRFLARTDIQIFPFELQHVIWESLKMGQKKCPFLGGLELKSYIGGHKHEGAAYY